LLVEKNNKYCIGIIKWINNLSENDSLINWFFLTYTRTMILHNVILSKPPMKILYFVQVYIMTLFRSKYLSH